jgi:RNA polymerase sigma-70 factor (ECF subfamily)
MEPDDISMVGRIRSGERAAADELVEAYYERIYCFLRRRAGNDADAADLTQRTFGRVWQALPGFAGRSSISSWMHGIARHVYLDWRRSDGHTEARSDEWWAERASTAAHPDEVAVRNDLAARIYESVDGLEPDLCDTVHLHYYQGLTLQETADAMGVAASTVKYRLRQALAELQKNLAIEGIRPKTPATLK